MIQHNKQMIPGKVIKEHDKPRSYILQTNEGRTLRRNRGHIKPTRAEFTSSPELINYRKDSKNSEIAGASENIVRKDETSVTEKKSIQKSSQSESSPVKPQSISTRSGRLIKVPDKYKDFDLNSVMYSEDYL